MIEPNSYRGCDKLEEQIRRVLIERNVSDFVDDDQFVAANLLQFRFEPACMVCGTEAGNPVRCRVEEDGVAGVGRFDAESDWMCVLPMPGGPSRITFSAFATKVPVAKCANTSRRSDGR